MGKIIAKGTHLKLPVTLVCENVGNEVFVTFNDEVNALYEEYFFDRMKECHVISGAYVPDEDSMLNALNVCQHYFFDSEPKIQIEGDIGEIPYEKHKIY